MEQQVVLGMRARLWREGSVAKEESYRLRSCLYFAQEVVSMLNEAGFRDVVIEGNYTGMPATRDDANVIFVATRSHASGRGTLKTHPSCYPSSIRSVAFPVAAEVEPVLEDRLGVKT